MTKKYAEYNVDLRANLDRIKPGDTEAWLKVCDEKFRCPKCGKPLLVFGYKRKLCYHCGADLRARIGIQVEPEY